MPFFLRTSYISSERLRSSCQGDPSFKVSQSTVDHSALAGSHVVSALGDRFSIAKALKSNLILDFTCHLGTSRCTPQHQRQCIHFRDRNLGRIPLTEYIQSQEGHDVRSVQCRLLLPQEALLGQSATLWFDLPPSGPRRRSSHPCPSAALDHL